ncbi:MAG: hypothetical protein ACOX3E_05510 [Desulfomonilia bacterium]|jgi:hypothetical protein|uniref:Uncharacterized protein n=1 Tax=anaerobic digester metagenome TaxID=1263854 RepID=A0A485LVA8_9ZZZZ|nr:hypothetical protein [Pseudomonadota bacterium]HON37594.1 hypothetical protein [Deltaproteobacteria bacterium]HRS55101.1 hypothetical protein [Desulfomonilia bacterium]HPD21452.1 hypothetical protein [Deltaproteobacteria bacterium]HPX19476.1 hypothetical protein [Deltaproteobacteria bacterium]
MNIRVLLPAAIFGAIFAVLWITGPVSCADRSSPAKPSADVEREVEEAAEAIRDYSIEQRDEALRQGRKAMDDIDSRIIRFREQISEHWNEMEPEMRSQARETLKALQQQRSEVARRLDELRTSSAGAWEEVKQGFVRSYEDLRRSFERAGETY